MITDGSRDFSPVYTAWLRKPVVSCNPPMPRPHPLQHILGESAASLRVRFKPGWEMDLRKELILAVEEDAATPDSCLN